MSRFYIFCILYCICPTAWSSTGLSCPESLPTVSTVIKCPSNEIEWKSAAQKKSCHNLSKVQNCTSAEKFAYHCVLNKEATMLLEVCAPVWFISGYCARYSTEDKRIVNEPGLDCTKFVPACPSRFMSNESYKYQTCYRGIGDKKVHNSEQCKNNDYSIIGAFLAVAIIAVVILLLFIFYDKKLKQCRNPKIIRVKGDEDKEESKDLMTCPEEKREDVDKNSPENQEKVEDIVKGSDETEDNFEDNKNKDDKRENGKDCAPSIIIERPEIPREENGDKMDFETISGKIGTVSVEGVNDISMLREKLSEKLRFPKEIVWVVVQEDGIIYNDETSFEELKKHQDKIQVVIGNNNRIVHDASQDSNVETDIISNKPLTSSKCRMSCKHFTAPENVFEYTKNTLTKGEAVVQCPRCSKTWEMSELVQKCDMTRDEKLFFERLMSLNLMPRLQFSTSVRIK